jgi:hypothetical protein
MYGHELLMSTVAHGTQFRGYRHLQVLEESKLVSITKNTGNERPQTACKITALGR